MSEIIWRLRQDHKNMARLIGLIGQEIDIHREGGTPDYALIELIMQYSVNYPDLIHHPLEDLVFEKLKRRDPNAVHDMGNLREEHEKLAGYARRFAAAVRNVQADHELPRDWFASVAADYCNGLKRHMQMEEVLFFPPALRALTEDDWADIEQKVTAKEDPLFGSQVDEEYARLHKDIVNWSKMSDGDEADTEELHSFR